MTTATVGATANYYTATGLSASTTYYYRVRATNGAGVSANTATVSATTGSAARLFPFLCPMAISRRYGRLQDQLEYRRRRYFHVSP